MPLSWGSGFPAGPRFGGVTGGAGGAPGPAAGRPDPQRVRDGRGGAAVPEGRYAALALCGEED